MSKYRGTIKQLNMYNAVISYCMCTTLIRQYIKMFEDGVEEEQFMDNLKMDVDCFLADSERYNEEFENLPATEIDDNYLRISSSACAAGVKVIYAEDCIGVLKEEGLAGLYAKLNEDLPAYIEHGKALDKELKDSYNNN